jgi:hypothetical protein
LTVMGLMITYLKNEFHLKKEIFLRECFEHLKKWKFKMRVCRNIRRIGPTTFERTKRNVKG